MKNFNGSDELHMQKFNLSFDFYPMSDDFRREIYNYIVMGLHPGGFHTALLERDLCGAVTKSHPLNNWGDIRYFVQWTMFNAPPDSCGYVGCVEFWCGLSQDERRERCEAHGILDTAWDILKNS